MKPLSDRALSRLREVSELPDLGGTRYSMIRELGRGGMGVVYLVEDTVLGRQAALKVLHHDDISRELADRMRKEARALARLEHPGIVPLYDFGELEGNRLYYVMRYIEGRRLDDLANAPLPDKLRLFEKICETVAFSHSRGVIHRDLKPSNIMIGAFGEVLVLDWGLARVEGDTEPQGRRMGTEGYMPPEQADGASAIDERVDIYALGCILRELIGGATPKPLASVIRKATAADRAQRYATVTDLANDVLRFVDGMAVGAHPEQLVEKLQRFYRHNRTLLLLVLAYVVMRFLVLFWLGR